MCINYDKQYTCGHKVYIMTIKCKFSIAIDELDISSDPCELVTLVNKWEKLSRVRGFLLEQACGDCLLDQGIEIRSRIVI